MMRCVYYSGKSTVRSRVEFERGRRLPQRGIVRGVNRRCFAPASVESVVNCRVEGIEEE